MMKPLLRSIGSLWWTVLIFAAICKNSNARCSNETCTDNLTEGLTITTTTVTFGPTPNCTLSSGSHSGNGSLSGLTQGTLHQILIGCSNCCIEVATKPEAVGNLQVRNTTTSSIYLTWEQPVGASPFYEVSRFQATETRVTATSINITGLSAGTNYDINVTAVAEDDATRGEIRSVSQYTKPGQIVDLTASTDTNSISLSWTAPAGRVLRYRVEWHNGGASSTKNRETTTAVLSALIPGTKYTITIVSIAEDNATEGYPYTFSSVTKPSVVKDLDITEITTSTVSLNWSKPMGNATSYKVQWTLREGTLNNTGDTSDTSFLIPNLIPGYEYNIAVAAVAEDQTMGNETQIQTFTSPVKPVNIRATQGTRDMNITWTLPEGRVDHYVVNIYYQNLTSFNRSQVTDTIVHFANLAPGRSYVVTVTAVAGNISNTSNQSSFATVPTPPGPISVSSRTTTSLQLQWATPAMMEGAPNITYLITYKSSDNQFQSTSASISTVLSPLSSGTSYNISVRTAGPQNLNSTDVDTTAYTLPHPVLDLVASPANTTTVRLEWSDPMESKPYYKYIVQAYNAATGVLLSSQHPSGNSINIGDLEPGTEYNFSVTTMAASESNSTEEWTSGYTRPKAVTHLEVMGVNATAIQVMWSQQSDHKESYYYLVVLHQDGNLVKNVSTKTERFTFIDLSPGHLYRFDVVTVVEGVKSTVNSTTGRTSPDQASNIVAIGSTTNMTVSWDLAYGRVDSYSVYLYRDSQLKETNSVLSNTTDNVNFPSLKPGVIYCVIVVTISGDLERNSSIVCNATFPNPPVNITVTSQTIDSIHFSWEFPDDMDRDQYNFSVSSHENETITKDNQFSLGSLASGTPYSISVVTVGLRGYKSTPVTTRNYTKPYPVTSLRAVDVTTDTVILKWEQQEMKPDYTYTVQVTNGSMHLTQEDVLNTTTTHTVPDLLSGSNYTFTVWAQTADGTQADRMTVSLFTQPYEINGLQADPLNSTAMRLFWTKPWEHKDGYTYRVVTTGCASRDEIKEREETVIPMLNPGTNCTFCVSVRAADGTEGKAQCTTQYTKPEAVQPSMDSQGSNSSMLVSWAKPHGNVEYYVISFNGPQRVDSTKSSFLFGDLSPGILYSASVTTHSGPFSASSANVSNATFPNPPGPIVILMKTTNSITLQWKEAPLMRSGSFHYQLTRTSSDGTKYKNVSGTNHTFESLLSGTPYKISLATVGALGLQSAKVYSGNVTTRPLPVKNLGVSAEEENVTVRWTHPDDYKTSYCYNISWASSTGLLKHAVQHVDQPWRTIEDLIPGTKYLISVTTVTADGTESSTENTSVCTNASPVKNLSCEGPNHEIAEILLTWSEPRGRYSRVELTLNNTEVVNVTSTCNQTCSHIVSNLSHYTEYTLSMETQSCGQPSITKELHCRTGITKPPIPVNSVSLAEVTGVQHNRFTLQIDPSLLVDTNGPVTHFGVLVTDRLSDVDFSDLKRYLPRTYREWSDKQSPAYLATVIKRNIETRSGDNQLTVHVGDETKWEDYTNGVLRSHARYWYAIVIFTNVNVNDGLVEEQSSLVSITTFYPAIALPQNPEVIAISVGATLGVFFILFIILIGFIIYWKRISQKESSDIQIHSMRAKVSAAVRVEDYEAYYKKQKADTNCGFAEEFEDLKLVGTGQSKTHALTQENKPKNRYNNVLPYDSSRVRLSIIHGSPYDDYINANYMPGYNSRKEFIAAQGPLPGTVNEFWRMIWEKNVQTVVMLTRCNEQGRVKCEQYWNSGTKHFENITVKTVSEIPLEDWTIRDFDIKNVKTAETRPVRQFHFTAWPDHGVPETTELLISFRHLVREHMDQFSRHSPAVVHCSAGVGRTGTFIAIDRLLFQIERENIVDVYGTVYDLRMHRTLMVQTEDQYVFLNQCAIDIIRSRTGTNVDLIYQNTAALSIYENVQPKKGFQKNGYHNA